MLNKRLFWEPGQVEVFESEEDIPELPPIVAEGEEEDPEES